MNLITLGSSSTGNCHILSFEDSQLMLDCGVKHNKVISYVQQYSKDKLKGILITHSH